MALVTGAGERGERCLTLSGGPILSPDGARRLAGLLYQARRLQLTSLDLRWINTDTHMLAAVGDLKEGGSVRKYARMHSTSNKGESGKKERSIITRCRGV